MIKEMVSKEVGQALANVTADDTPTKTVNKPPKQQEVTDWSGMSNADLWAIKVKGASEEKIRRSYEAICLYNDGEEYLHCQHRDQGILLYVKFPSVVKIY